MASREASHAGSWYSSNKASLSRELDGWLDAVPDTSDCIGPESISEEAASFPTAGARVIIAPHAGYSYSGRAAAWAYKALDLSKAKRVFILGPSHHFYLTRCALSRCQTYETPLGNLKLDLETIVDLHDTGKFDKMSQSVDEDEHSIEMHLPYLYKVLSRTFGKEANFPPIVPILVGNTAGTTEVSYGQILAPYLADSSNAFIVSSDFAHWGLRFHYTYYEPGSGATPMNLMRHSVAPSSPAIHESIANVDMKCIAACEKGTHEGWLKILEKTGNTVCGRHPIGIVMAGLEALRDDESIGTSAGLFKFVRYERSSDCVDVADSSVSYASAFAVL